MAGWGQWRDNWRFFAEFPDASRGLTAAWLALGVSLGVLPALFAVATGELVAAVQRGTGLPAALALTGTLFVSVQVIAPLQGMVSTSLGERLNARLNDRILAAAIEPTGLGHLEDPGLADDLAAARDFELELAGPSMPTALQVTTPEFTAFVAGLVQAVILAGYRWWAGLLIMAGWLAGDTISAAHGHCLGHGHRQRARGPAPGRPLIPGGCRSGTSEGNPALRPIGVGGGPVRRCLPPCR